MIAGLNLLGAIGNFNTNYDDAAMSTYLIGMGWGTIDIMSAFAGIYGVLRWNRKAVLFMFYCQFLEMGFAIGNVLVGMTSVDDYCEQQAIIARREGEPELDMDNCTRTITITTAIS